MKSKAQKRIEAAIRQAEADLTKHAKEVYVSGGLLTPDKWMKDHRKRGEGLAETLRRLKMELSQLMGQECQRQAHRR